MTRIFLQCREKSVQFSCYGCIPPEDGAFIKLKRRDFMPQYICPKWKDGSLKFEVDWVNQRLALREDFTANGSGSGAWFSQKWLPFDAINAKLQSGLTGGGSFMGCFGGQGTINDSTMLCAVLLSLGCIDSNHKTLCLLSPMLQQGYDKINPPVV